MNETEKSIDQMEQSSQMDKLILIGGNKEDTKEFLASHPDVNLVLEQGAQNKPYEFGRYIVDIRLTLSCNQNLDFGKSLIEQVKSDRPEHKDWPLWKDIDELLSTYEEFKPDILTKKTATQVDQQVIDVAGTLLLDIVKKRPDVEMLFCYNGTAYDQKNVFEEDKDETLSKVLRKLYHDPELQKKVRFNNGKENTVAPWEKNPVLWEKYSKKYEHENKRAIQNFSVPQQETQIKPRTSMMDIKKRELKQTSDSTTKDMQIRKNKRQER
ncbi:hypothetical protein ACFC4I_04260 [Enterococcus durans]|uniref:hypothetical protein n=1 Tax=Enterococcus durans TaxID=53345 RepID=UPI0035DD3595